MTSRPAEVSTTPSWNVDACHLDAPATQDAGKALRLTAKARRFGVLKVLSRPYFCVDLWQKCPASGTTPQTVYDHVSAVD